jgi:hypothetical protein
VDAFVGAWLADAIFLPIGIILTIKAMNDSKFVNFDDTLRNIRKKIAARRAR